MTLAELSKEVEASPRYEAEEAEIEGEAGEPIKGVIVSDTQCDAAAHISFATLNKLDWPRVQVLAACGRDVTGYTRVTGYMAPTSSFNKGKVAELRDRHKVTID